VNPKGCCLASVVASLVAIVVPVFQQLTKPDERTRTADLPLQVINQALQELARACKSPIGEQLSSLRLIRNVRLTRAIRTLARCMPRIIANVEFHMRAKVCHKAHKITAVAKAPRLFSSLPIYHRRVPQDASRHPVRLP